MQRLLLIIPACVYTIAIASTVASHTSQTIINNPFYQRILPQRTIQVANQLRRPLSPASAISIINRYRTDANLSALEESANICQSDPQSVFQNCPNCSHASLLRVNPTTQTAFENSLKLDEATQNMINNPKLTHICIQESQQSTTIILARINNQPFITPTQQNNSVNQDFQPKNFSEDELWSGLVQYRQAHLAPDLQKDELLCQYARKRVADHLNMQQNLQKADYPVPEKYPLDAHQGFINDADSGFAFEVTQKNVLAENLAYWPSVEYAHQVIEWGWDSSTEGHRETQLSTDYSKACISGQQGFYVAIFSN